MYRIFASVPIVWVGETTVQIGSDDPVYLEGLTVADVEFINCLRLGVPAHDFDTRAQRCGVTPERAVALLALLDEAQALDPSNRDVDADTCYDAYARSAGLHPDRVSAAVSDTSVGITGPLCTDVTAALQAAGFTARAASADAPARPGEIVVLTALLAADLLAAGELFDDDIRHVHFVLGESAATLSHLICPGVTPCSGCQVAHSSGTDDAWLEAWRSLRGAHWDTRRTDAGLLALACAQLALQLRNTVVGLDAGTVGCTIRLPFGDVETTPAEFSDSCTCRVPLSRSLAS